MHQRCKRLTIVLFLSSDAVILPNRRWSPGTNESVILPQRTSGYVLYAAWLRDSNLDIDRKWHVLTYKTCPRTKGLYMNCLKSQTKCNGNGSPILVKVCQNSPQKTYARDFMGSPFQWPPFFLGQLCNGCLEACFLQDPEKWAIYHIKGIWFEFYILFI